MSDGQNISPSKDKKEFFSLELSFLLSLLSSLILLIETKQESCSDCLGSIDPKTRSKGRKDWQIRLKLRLKVLFHLCLEKTVEKARPYHLKFGLNHVTKLIEERKAKVVVIANNVDPIELVVWLPNLCRKMDIPYCFVKGKSKLGQLVHQKNAAVVALTDVRKEDEGDLSNLANAFRTNFNENVEIRKVGREPIRGNRSQIKYNKLMAEKER